MKKTPSYSIFKRILIGAGSTIIASLAYGAIQFGYTLGNRVTKLETAFIDMSNDIHDMRKDIKTLIRRSD